ncbi:hypothetical protein WME99_30445 [Sorangium sp. So ce136]
MLLRSRSYTGAMHDDFSKNGFAPVNVSVEVAGGQQRGAQAGTQRLCRLM